MGKKIKKILLMGNPNVGKSVVFSRMTGIHVVAANYPGTTVNFFKGEMRFGGDKVEVIDVPGTYSLKPTCKAEEVAVEMLFEGDVVVNVIDSTNLERNLNLTLQLIERGVRVIVALNLWDETAHHGITIDPRELENLLGVPVVTTTAVTGEGIKRLVDRIEVARAHEPIERSDGERWLKIGEIVSKSQQLVHHHHTFLQRLGDASVRPHTGLMIAALVLFISFWVVRFVSEGLIGFVFDPLFDGVYKPLLMSLSSSMNPGSFLHEVVIGRLINGDIDFMQSFGLLTTGIYIPLAAVLPYVLSFYLVLGFLEDLGYLPRVAVLLDTLMHKMGLHGYAIIPNMLGLGCNVPAILATRSLESKRERFIAITLVSIGVPCASLQAMILGVVGARGIQYVLLVYFVLFLTWIFAGVMMNLFAKGFSPEMILEVPPLRLPSPKVFLKKYWIRVWLFMKEGVPIELAGVFIATVLYYIGLFEYVARIAAPIVKGVWGLPTDAITALVIGFLRKDLAIGMFGSMDLTTHQLVVGSAVLAMFFPCIASFVVILRELGLKLLALSTLVMIVVAIVSGGLLNLCLHLF